MSIRSFVPLPNLFYSFPFQIFEQFIAGRPALEEAYSHARAQFLEDKIESHISTSMPSAKVYKNVMWRDPTTERLYENDVVALIGNTIFCSKPNPESSTMLGGGAASSA
jgi:hypothetical protein